MRYINSLLLLLLFTHPSKLAVKSTHTLPKRLTWTLELVTRYLNHSVSTSCSNSEIIPLQNKHYILLLAQ